MKRSDSFRAMVSCLILILIQSSCATIPRGPSPEDRVSFGAVGVSRASYLPETEFAVPAKGRPDGAVKGAGIAFIGVFAGGMQAGAAGAAGPGAGLYLAFLAALATVAAPVGAVMGAVKAMPGKEAAAFEKSAMEILERMRTQEVLRDEVVRVGNVKTGRRLVPVEGVGPAEVDNTATYETLLGTGIDTVLEVSLRRITLESETWGSNPPLKYTMKARCRLIRVQDGAVIDDHEYSTMSVYRKFSEWGADNAALLGQAYEEGYRDLSTAMVDRIFLQGNKP